MNTNHLLWYLAGAVFPLPTDNHTRDFGNGYLYGYSDVDGGVSGDGLNFGFGDGEMYGCGLGFYRRYNMGNIIGSGGLYYAIHQ